MVVVVQLLLVELLVKLVVQVVEPENIYMVVNQKQLVIPLL